MKISDRIQKCLQLATDLCVRDYGLVLNYNRNQIRFECYQNMDGIWFAEIKKYVTSIPVRIEGAAGETLPEALLKLEKYQSARLKVKK